MAVLVGKVSFSEESVSEILMLPASVNGFFGNAILYSRRGVAILQVGATAYIEMLAAN